MADHLHAELMEMAHRVVLLCPVHGCGLHPALREDGAVWRCAVGAHVVGVLGSLPVADSGTASRQQPPPVLVTAVDPEHSLLQQDEAVYQVHFWSRPGGADTMWRREEYRLEGATDLREVLAWAEREAAGRRFTLYVEAVVDDELSLLHLTGDDPTRLPSPCVQLEVVLTDGVDPDVVAALVAAAGQSGRYALARGDGPPWRAVFQIPLEDHEAVAEALVPHLRDEGYEAALTSWE